MEGRSRGRARHEEAKSSCPISKLLNTKITLDARRSFIVDHGRRSVVPERLTDALMHRETNVINAREYYEYVHFSDAVMTDQEILENMLVRITQQDVVYRRYLVPTHRSYVPDFGVYIKVQGSGGEVEYRTLSRQLVLFCVERRKAWRMLQSKAGIENREYSAQRAILAEVDSGKISKEELFANGEALMKARIGKPVSHTPQPRLPPRPCRPSRHCRLPQSPKRRRATARPPNQLAAGSWQKKKPGPLRTRLEFTTSYLRSTLTSPRAKESRPNANSTMRWARDKGYRGFLRREGIP